MSLIKESDLDLGLLKSSGKLDEIISYLDENLERSNQIQDITFKELGKDLITATYLTYSNFLYVQNKRLQVCLL